MRMETCICNCTTLFKELQNDGVNCNEVYEVNIYKIQRVQYYL
jgi:hypothetical protein